MATSDASIWTSGIASLAPEDILRLLKISDTYVKSSVVTRTDEEADTAIYALGVSNLYELHKAISANVLVIHINPDCSSLIQEQRRRLRDIRMRRNIEWITILGVFSSVFITHWVKHQRLLGDQRHGQSSLIQDLKALFSSSPSPATQNGPYGNIDTRLPASMIMSMEGFRKDPLVTEGRAHNNRRYGFCWVSVLSPLWKDRSNLLLTSTLIASIAFQKRSRHDYELIKIFPTDQGSAHPEYFLIRQDALHVKQTVVQQTLERIPLLVAAVTSTILIRRCFKALSA
ncbi:hypothetical protein INT43_000700 [Umbelopsis isabellina]|uniref:Uncharacterized protein n=1 Tax=Mortierella isabellina TaxID=91625 RepID=A0A8H7Q2L0_MORIS|nr:hypothetical protein INT43_000700 [Umbelopsis isabellina]